MADRFEVGEELVDLEAALGYAQAEVRHENVDGCADQSTVAARAPRGSRR